MLTASTIHDRSRQSAESLNRPQTIDFCFAPWHLISRLIPGAAMFSGMLLSPMALASFTKLGQSYALPDRPQPPVRSFARPTGLYPLAKLAEDVPALQLCRGNMSKVGPKAEAPSLNGEMMHTRSRGTEHRFACRVYGWATLGRSSHQSSSCPLADLARVPW